ncbi:MAG: WhiB family transcriptional regulator [Ferrimicrobium sp.]|uniref:Transcriptional regulator WhiB n=1 Tax=Ferrimicrobium acidiphilum TaxID=121039 RepID=A0ABV3Y2U7_9ACTN|nr:WhiB family transcriptional regulator [Ferrimicrobium sp.]
MTADGVDEIIWVSEPWMALGACRGLDPAIFFPSDGAGVVGARKICLTCTVMDDCLEYALKHRIEHGVWGGSSERERKRLQRAQLVHG